MLGLLKGGGGEEERISTKWLFGRFQVSYLNTVTVAINGFNRSGHASVCCLATYFYIVTHVQQSLSRFTRNTLIEVAILNPGHFYIPTY